MRNHEQLVEANVLAENLFSLEEPWRGRFLTFVAQRANGGQVESSPSQEQVETWLGSGGLRLAVSWLLDLWHGVEM